MIQNIETNVDMKYLDAIVIINKVGYKRTVI